MPETGMPEFKVAAVDEVPCGKGRSVRVEDRQIALFNVDGNYYAIDDRCPHMGADLSCGVLKERTVMCTWHGWQFDLESGSCLNVKWAKVQQYPLILRGRDLFLTIEPEPDPDEATEEDEAPQIVWKNPFG